jgi:hypothetical protein
MNNRIKELAEQAKFETTTRTHVIDGPRQIFFGDAAVIQKFAELIVKECAQICFSESKGHDMAFGEHCGIVIKEHFGVEE